MLKEFIKKPINRIDMMKKIKNIFKSQKNSMNFTTFVNTLEHAWIKEDKYLNSSFEEFFSNLKANHLKIMSDKKVLILRSNGMYSCTFENMDQTIIIVFPDLSKMLKSFDSRIGQAILGHELGHVILNHSVRKIDLMTAQIEADRFACEIGYTQEIEEFLLSMPESTEKRMRLSYLTQFVLRASGIQS